MQDENDTVTESTPDPTAPSIEPSHGVAPAQTVPDPVDDGDAADGDLDDTENDEIEEPDDSAEAADDPAADITPA